MNPYIQARSSRQAARKSQRRPSAAARGFTLTELMVALTGGLFVSMVVFALARDGSRFYHREARVAEATLGNVIGFDRLRADIARAGFLSTPNLSADINAGRFCGSIAQFGGFPRLQQLASIQINADDAAALNTTLASATPPIKPNSILLAGAYSSLDRFDAYPLNPPVNNQYAVRLATNLGALQRLNYVNLSATQRTALLAQLFPARRVLRLVDVDSGYYQFGIIAGTGFDANGFPNIFLATAPALRVPGAAAAGCSAKSNQLVNVVNFIRYSLTKVIGNTTDFPDYQQLFDTTSSLNLPGEADRLELVREEIDAFDNSVAASREVIAEYAVDLRFAITYVVNPMSATPTLLTAPYDSANLFAFAGPVLAANPTAQPQNIRSVRVRLSVRSREADRDANVSQTEPNIAPGLYRIGLGVGGTKPFARVRTLQADTFIASQTR